MVLRLLSLTAALTFHLSSAASAADPPTLSVADSAPVPRTLTEGELRGILAALEDPSPQVRACALRYCPNSIHGTPGLAWPVDNPLCLEISQSIARSLPLGWPNAKVQGATALGGLGPAAAPQASALIALLRDPEREVVEAAVDALGRLGAAVGPRAAEIVPLLGDPDLSVKIHAASALGGLGSAAAPHIPALVALLRERNSFVGEAAADALGRLGAVTLPHTGGICALFHTGNVYARMAAARAIGNLGPAAGAHAADLATLLRDRDQDVALAAVVALGKLGAAAAPQAAEMSALLRHRDGYLRGAAADALSRLGPAGVPYASEMGKLLEDPDGYQQGCFAAGALARLGPAAAAPHIAGITAMLKDTSADVRIAAARALARLGAAGPERVAVLIDLVKKPALYDDVRSAATLALAEPGSFPAAPQAPALIALLRDPDYKVREAAVWALRRLGSAAAPEIPRLITLLADTDRRVNMSAAQALGALGGAAAPHAAEVAALLSNPDQGVKFAVILVLGEMKGAAVPNAAALGPLLRDPDARIRNWAASGLSKLGPVAAAPYVEQLCSILVVRSGPRAWVDYELARLGIRAAPYVADDLIALLNNPSEDVRYNAISLLEFSPELIDKARASEPPGTHPPSDPRMLLEAAWSTFRYAPKMGWLAYYLAGDDADNRWLIRYLLPRWEPGVVPEPLPVEGEEWRAAVTRLTRAARLWKQDAPRTVAAMAGLAAALTSEPPPGDAERALVEDLRKALAEAGHEL